MTSVATAFFEESLIGCETIHQTGKLFVVLDLETATTGFQGLCLIKLPVVGTEDDGHVPDGCLQRVVDAYSETASDICHIAIIVDAAQKTETVDNQRVGLGGFLARGLSETDDFTGVGCWWIPT